MLELIRKICAAHGVAGFEKKAAETLCTEIKNYTDEQYTDALGNLIAVKRGKGNGKKIMERSYLIRFCLRASSDVRSRHKTEYGHDPTLSSQLNSDNL